jgi:GTP cyclohydrolase I
VTSGERILGLSRLVRVVGLFARDLQTQERLTGQVAGRLGAAGGRVRDDPRTRAEFLALAMTMRG